jgi:hypothetical protein
VQRKNLKHRHRLHNCVTNTTRILGIIHTIDILHCLCMCWLPYPQNYIPGNTPYGTGNATHTGNVRCPYRYCTPLYFTSFLANALHYVPIQSLYCYRDTRCQFWYGNQENYSTGSEITTKDVSTGMVIHKITVPVLSLQCKTSFPVW